VESKTVEEGHVKAKAAQLLETEENPLMSMYRAYLVTLIIAAGLMIIAARFML